MNDMRSKSYRDELMQIESYYGDAGEQGGMGPTSNGVLDLRCQSASSYARSQGGPQVPRDHQLKKGSKSTNGSIFKEAAWCFSDPELQRKKRVASYKVYTVEGKMKGSIRKSFRWLKDKCSHVVNGWW